MKVCQFACSPRCLARARVFVKKVDHGCGCGMCGCGEKQQSEAAADEAAEAARRLEHHNARKVLFDSAGGVKAAIAGLVCSQDTKQPDDPPPETPL